MKEQVYKKLTVQEVAIGGDGRYHALICEVPIYAVKLNKKNLCRPMGLRYNKKKGEYEEVPLCRNWKKAGSCSECIKIAKGVK